MVSYYDPKRNAQGYHIDPAAVNTHLPSAILQYAPRFCKPLRNSSIWTYYAFEVFDRWVARHLPECDIVWAWAGWAIHTFREARRRHVITVLERSCPHIEHQVQLLDEESRSLGGGREVVSSWLYQRMLEEYELADYIAVPSTYSLNSFLERGFKRSRLLMIPLSAGLPAHPSDSTREKGREFTVLLVGGDWDYRKGLYYLLQAWRRLQLPNAKLLIRSEVPNRFHELALRDDVMILPHLSPPELVALYRRVSVFCLPSVDDGFGMVVLEAMREGVPVIVTENVGAKDLIRDGEQGFIVPIRDPDALKEKIEYFYRNEEQRLQMGMAARRLAEVYTWDRYGDQVCTELERIREQRAEQRVPNR